MARNLVEQLGTRYVQEMCANAVFLVGEKVHILQQAERTGLYTHSLDLSKEKSRLVAETIAVDSLKSLADLAYPKLGYRELDTESRGKAVISVDLMRSALRGLRMDRLRVGVLPQFLRVDAEFPDVWFGRTTEKQLRAIYRPTFTPFAAGVKSILDGDSIGFAVNEDIAVVLACDNVPNQVGQVLFRGRKVGGFDEKGNINLANKIMQRESLRSKFGV